MNSYSNVACVAASSNSEVAGERDQQEAYEKTLSAILAIDPDEVIVHTFDINSAVASILRAFPEIVRFWDLLWKRVPQFDASLFDNLEWTAAGRGRRLCADPVSQSPLRGLLSVASDWVWNAHRRYPALSLARGRAAGRGN